jgi:hypothetical protein
MSTDLAEAFRRAALARALDDPVPDASQNVTCGSAFGLVAYNWRSAL